MAREQTLFILKRMTEWHVRYVVEQRGNTDRLFQIRWHVRT